jgi:hypothetical protein
LADDDCRRLGRECRRDSQCCTRNCVRRRDDKVCACPTGRTRCKDNCVNLETNERHCGRCFNRCPDEQECVRGECQGGEPICTPSCPSGCECGERADGTGTVCTDCTTGCALVTSCEQCSPGTICVVEVPGNPPTGFLCGNPCQSCAQNGSTCMANDQCCSGRCASGMCAEQCPSGTATLSNGTCAHSCTGGSFDCVAAGCQGCINEVGGDGIVAYCRGSGGLGDCTSNADCDPGQFCGSSASTGSGSGFCVTGC